jgi:hypothetical protein
MVSQRVSIHCGGGAYLKFFAIHGGNIHVAVVVFRHFRIDSGLVENFMTDRVLCRAYRLCASCRL